MFGRYSCLLVMFLFALPNSTNYQMRDFGFGTGGVNSADSTNYSINAITGEQSAGKLSGTTYDLGPGLLFTQQADVPAAPTFSNPDNYYNRLLLILTPGANPSDTVYAVAISDDNFVTTKYVQSDFTVGSVLGVEDYLTYSTWGSGSGQFITGLSPSTTYKVRVKAMQGKFTETDYGPQSSAATVAPSLVYDIDVAAIDTESSPPYTVSFGSLVAGSVTTASNRVWVDVETNADNGAQVYVYDASGGLQSVNAGYTIAGATANLTSVSEGYGLQVASVVQTSGGPFVAVSPYNGGSENVGVLDTTSRTLFTSSGARISAGRGSVYLKAKAGAQTPSAGDYADTITMVASASF